MSVGTAVSDLARRRARGSVISHRQPLVRPAWVAVLALTTLAAVLRFYRLGHQGFWFDEANTALLVHFSPGKMLGLIPQTESTPPLYYCIAWVWAHVFGYGEVGLRSLSALAGVATVPVAYGAASRLISVRAGLIAAALTACNPLLVWYSQEARSYALLVLLTSLSLLAFAYARARPTGGVLAAWVIASALALATHYYAVLLIVPEAIWLLAVHRSRRPAQIAVAIVTACGLALIPLAISQNGTGRANWIGHAALARRVKEIAPQFVTGFGSPAYAVLEPVAVALAALALVLLLARPIWPQARTAVRAQPAATSASAGRSGALLAGGLAVAGLILSLLLVAAGIDDLLTRNVLSIWMPALLAVAGGLTAPRARVVGLVGALALCSIGIVASVGVARDRNLQRPDWRAVARVLGPRPAAGVSARAILIQHYRDLLPLSLYLPGLKFDRGRRAVRVSELDVISFTSPPSAGFCWWGSACNLWPSRIQSSYPVAGFRAVWRRRAYQFTIVHMVASSGQVLLTPRSVSAVLRTTNLRNDELLYQR